MSEEIIIHEKQSTISDFEFDFKMSLEEFRDRCLPTGQGYQVQSAEFMLLPVNVAVKDGVSYSFKTENNVVYFNKIV